jgi:hypothetical protein
VEIPEDVGDVNAFQFQVTVGINESLGNGSVTILLWVRIGPGDGDRFEVGPASPLEYRPGPGYFASEVTASPI